jgi:hypothetical protein
VPGGTERVNTCPHHLDEADERGRCRPAVDVDLVPVGDVVAPDAAWRRVPPRVVVYL